MKIWWFKDSKIGHEKQVKAILDCLNFEDDLEIEEIMVTNSIWYELILYFLRIKPNRESSPDLIIGAGAKTTIPMLRHKKDVNTKVVSVMKPQFFNSKFDLIVAPRHDFNEIPANVFTYMGSMAKVNINLNLENIGLLIVGGKNEHYEFNNDYLISQINFVISLFPELKWIIFNSRRTPERFNRSINKNECEAQFINVAENFEPLDGYISRAKIRFITPDSVNMVFESLSSSGETYLFDMKRNGKNKITKLIDEIKLNSFVGYLKEDSIDNSSIKKISLKKPNQYHEPFAEVEKVVFAIKKLINLRT